MESEKMRNAKQKAFEQGQQAFREGKFENPFPPESPYHDLFEQGVESERKVHFD